MDTYSMDGGAPFSFNERLGMVFIVEVAFLSLLSTAFVLVYYLYLYVAALRDSSRSPPSTHIHHYFVSLLFADLIQALGSVLNIQWIIDAGVHENTVCTVQGALKQIGDVGVAMSTLVIAIHTTRVLVFRIEFPKIVPRLVVLGIWVFVAVMFVIGFGWHNARDIQFYGDTGYWCWITEDYSAQRITLEYLWLWVAAAVNIICYSCIFLVIQGYLVIAGRATRFITGKHRSSPVASTSRSNNIARQMLYYPAVYLVCILPMTVSRFIAFAGGEIPYGAIVFSSILFSASGLFNVILFKVTRPMLIPSRSHDRRSHLQSRAAHPPLTVSIKQQSFRSSDPATIELPNYRTV